MLQIEGEKISLVATDIDGTLADPHGKLAPATISALRNLLDLGMPLVLVTGLNPWVARRYAEQIGPQTRAICFNGIFLLEEEQVHEGQFLDLHVAREGVALAIEKGYTPMVYGEDGVNRFIPLPPGLTQVEALMGERPYQPFVAVNTLEDLFEVRPAAVSICETSARAAAIYPLLQAALGDRAYIVYQPATSTTYPQDRNWVEINHGAARKDVALLALAKRLGVMPDQILYFGDSLNDLPVFQVVAHSVAMSNARPEVQALAWRVTASNAEDGVARFLANLEQPDVSAGDTA